MFLIDFNKNNPKTGKNCFFVANNSQFMAGVSKSSHTESIRKEMSRLSKIQNSLIIDDYSQNMNNNNCWTLHGVRSLDISPYGRGFLSKAIEPDEDGYKIHLHKPDKVYKISSQEICDAQGEFASQSTEMLAIEIALEKRRISRIKSSSASKNLSKNLDNFCGDCLVNKPLSGGLLQEAVFYLTGRMPEMATYSQKECDVIGAKRVSPKRILNILNDNMSVYSAGISFKSTNRKDIKVGHAYTIAKVDKKTVYLMDKNKVVRCSTDFILDNVNNISCTRLD